MANEMITQLPSISSAQLTDIIYAVQGYVSPSSPGLSVQETLQQVFNLMLSQTILHNAGNPNGVVAGNIYQFCIDTTNSKLYICTTTGSSSTAVWTLYGANIVAPVQGGTGVSNPTAHALPVANGSSNWNFYNLTNGQLFIGSTGADPVPATLQAGAGITIGSNAGNITITASGVTSFTWTTVSGTSQNMAAFNGYIANNAGLVTLTLPATFNVGDQFFVIGEGAGGWSIAQNANQLIRVAPTSVTTTGVGGSLSSSGQFDAVHLVATVANTTLTVASMTGKGLTIV